MVRLQPQTDIGSLDIRAYQKLLPLVYRELSAQAKKLGTRTIIHINATPVGGGVAELLKSQVALERSLGFDSHWLAIEGVPKEFFVVTKKIHNLTQGGNEMLTEKEQALYRDMNRKLSASLLKFCKAFPQGGIIVVHDPQPAPLIADIPQRFLPILRLHVDLLTPNPRILEMLRPFVELYRYVVVSSEEYKAAFTWMPASRLKVLYPAIDPFTEKNKTMSIAAARTVLSEFSVNCTKPIVAQVSRFDPWKDPMGVIRAYYLAKNSVPDLQLVLVGFFLARDDMQALEIFAQVLRHAKGDPDIFLFSDTKDLGDISNEQFVSAVYTASTVVMQKSIREGFGLTMTEAMWKGRAVIAGRTTGGMAQIKHNKNGVLVSSPEEAAHALVRLLKDKRLRERLGRAAHGSVKKKFLFARFLLDNVKIYTSLCKPKK